MITAYLITDPTKAPIYLDTAPTLTEAIHGIRNDWNEEPTGPQTFLLTNEQGQCLATMMRGKDPEICLTTYQDARMFAHRCHYVLEDGKYVRTDITQVGWFRALEPV